MKSQIKLSILFTGLIFFLAMISCKKSHPETKNPKDILEGNSWKITAITVSPARNGVTDIYNDPTIVEPCIKDNLFKFNPGNVLVYDNGQVICDPSDPQTYPGTWNYDSNANNLTIYFSAPGFANEEVLHILEINENSFKGTITLAENGVTYTYTDSFQKQ